MLSESHSLGTLLYLSLKWVSYYLFCCLARLPETHLGSWESVWKNFANYRAHLCLSPSVPEGGWVTFPSGLCHNRVAWEVVAGGGEQACCCPQRGFHVKCHCTAGWPAACPDLQGTCPVKYISAATVSDADRPASHDRCTVRPCLLCPSSTHPLVHVDLCLR